MTNQINDFVAEAAKATPPTAVAGLTLSGVALADWVLLLTAIYTAIQIYFLVRDRWLKRKNKDGSKR